MKNPIPNAKRSWKTTLGGILAAAGSFLESHPTPILGVIGSVLQGLGLLLMGAAASD